SNERLARIRDRVMATLRRRDVLKLSAVALPAVLAGRSSMVSAAELPQSVARYLEGLRQPDGGYGWGDWPRSHLTPTYGAIGCYHVLGRRPPDADRAAEFVRSNHPFRFKKLERELKGFEYQQIQSLLWLERDASELRETIARWRTPLDYTRAYERHGYPVFAFEVVAIIGRKMLDVPLDDLAPEMIAYLDSRRRENGSFNNTPADDGSDGNILNTWWGLQALGALGRDRERRDETIAWVQRCQRDSGGFTWQPEPFMAAN